MNRLALVPVVIGVVMASCTERVEPVSAEVRQQKEAAYRVACASRELLGEAQANLELLESLSGPAGPDSDAAAVGSGVLSFSRAYLNHAELRSVVYANLDSAANHAESSSDSSRYVARAASFTVRTPEPESVEANVMESFETNMGRMLTDPDHPCNWDFPF